MKIVGKFPQIERKTWGTKLNSPERSEYYYWYLEGIWYAWKVSRYVGLDNGERQGDNANNFLFLFAKIMIPNFGKWQKMLPQKSEAIHNMSLQNF